MSNKMLNILVETQEFFEFFLQKYSKDFFLQEPKSGCEAQYAEWREKRELIQELIIWLETNVFELGNEEEKPNL